MQSKALILGNYRPAYILARSLQNRGFRVVCGIDGYDRGAEMSRYVSALWDHPPLKKDSGEFQQALDRLCITHPDIRLICPVAENFVQAFAEGHLEIPDGVALASLSHDVVNFCLDKPRLLATAACLGIPVAPFAVTTGWSDLFEKAESIGFPLVVRPLYSTVRLAGKKATTVHSMEELRTNYEIWQVENQKLLIQHHVSGKRDNIYFAAHKGELIRLLHAKIERTDQPDGSGLALEGVTIKPDKTLVAQVNALTRAMDYNGIGCAQFLVDLEKNQYYFLEINPRLAGNHALAEIAGLDLGGFIIDGALGITGETQLIHSQILLRYGWLAGECENLRARWQSGDLSTFAFIKKLYLAFKSYRRMDFDIAINRNDWKPGFFTLCDALPILGKLTRARFRPTIIRNLLIQKEWLKP